MDADTARDLAALRSTHESLQAQVARLQWLILVGVLATAVTSVLLRHPDSTRRAALAQQLSATVLLLGALAACIGLAWLPDDDDLAIRPAWGLLVALGAAGWAYHSAWSAKDR